MSLTYDFDYHMHTSLSDGQNTMEEMFEMAKSLGLKRFGITDHFELNAYNTVKISAEEYSREFDRIDALAKTWGIKFYRGIETGIGERGLLIPQRVIQRDYTVASVHKVPASEKCDEDEYWGKYRTLVENAVNRCNFEILGHVEGYLPIKNGRYGKTTFQQRREIERQIAVEYFSFDWYTQIAKAMCENDICLEIHGATASPRIEVIDLMRKRGVKLSFGSDAHTLEQMKPHRQYLTKVVNTLNLNDEDFIDLDAY